MTSVNALGPDELYARCDPDTLGFATTEDIEPLTGALGQEEAMAALTFGVTVPSAGYNIFVLGAPGSGRRTFVMEALKKCAREASTPPDWCYVYNFRDPRKPRALRLESGRGPTLARDIEELIADLRSAIPVALDTEDVVARRAEIVETREKEAAQLMDQLRREMQADPWVAVQETESTLTIMPGRGGEPIQTDAIMQLPEDVRDQIEQHLHDARARLRSVHLRIHDLQREARTGVAEFNREVARSVVEQHMARLRQKYQAAEPVVAYLDAVIEDIVEHAEQFMQRPEEQNDGNQLPLGLLQQDFFRRYAVNPFITHEPGSGAPVVEEPNPTYTAIIGHLARQLQFGVMVTDFTGVAPGALHRANGGFLLLEAEDILTRPYAWPALKRALEIRQLRPAEPAAEIGIFMADSLDPEPIPADLKVVLIGEPRIFYALEALDTEFRELFKVKADFRPHMPRTPETEQGYAAFIAAGVQRDSLPPFDAPAVALITEEGSRLASDQKKLTTRFLQIADLAREAAHWARADGRELVGYDDVARALRERSTRERRPHRELLELIDRGVLSFEPRGEVAGQLYGIALLAAGEEAFGRPIRVMASAYMGSAGVVNIEREVRLSGPIHSKGFLILTGFVGWRFARKRPLVLSANLSFDQTYEEVEGDSASAAELYALLSAIGNVPIHQGIAVTGAINQRGLILPVGGVTDKIEGFFAACQKAGLDGKQGVMLPRRNADNLVLRQEVRDAVADGQFNIWAIDRFEEGWPILAGIEAGTEDEDGVYPEGTAYRAVTDQLDQWHQQWQELAEKKAGRARRKGGDEGEGEGEPAGEDGGEGQGPGPGPGEVVGEGGGQGEG